MGVNWTKEQQQVITLRNRNILVSAAAGSGKTAVLVERIITRLVKDADPINVDELLIVTFTDAAAAEMKERILLAIEKKLEEDPGNVHLQRQAALIHSALITTIHSFCLSVIREHFHTIDLDPGFRIGEEGELKLLKKDVLEELLEEEYAKGDANFLSFVERFATGRDDRKIEELILQVYEFSRSYPEPEQWLSDCVDAYGMQDEEELEKSPAGQRALANIRQYIQDALALLNRGIDACEEPDGPYMYRETLEKEREGFQMLAQAETLSEIYEKKGGIDGGRLKPNRDKSVSKETTEFVRDMRKQAKEILSEMEKYYLFENPEELRRDMEETQDVVRELVRLVQRFAELFEEKKRMRNLIDFGDMEHLALRILTAKDFAVAKEYRKRFREVMIDEYQDSNLIQEAILTSVSTVEEGAYNIFMVGDIKQSIYRFRLSRPELFMEKFDTYDTVDGEKQRIDLHKNFRSRAEVLDSTNFIFGQIMIKKLGGIAYDENAALYAGADYPERPGNETEVLVVGQTEDAESGKELEARAIARRIKQLMESHRVVDKATGGFRNVQYRDIVILTRSLKGWTDVFAKILNREGIPTYTGSKEGYFETKEVQTVLDYLRVLDNPNQDIPLAAVLTSGIGGFTGEELAKIRAFQKELPFYRCVKMYAAEGDDPAIREKLQAVLAQIAAFREMIPYTAIHDLLWQVLEKTGYGYEVSAMPGGEQRKANLEMLSEKARAFEGTSYKGLFNFVRYIEQLKKYDVDYGEANIADEQADAVRLMSIHKSKGLEFPIVFVAGMNKQFNRQDSTGDLVIHPELGVGIDAVDLEKRTKAPTLLKKVIQREVTLENIGEELRVLYVALTRAKEKLIMTGTLPDWEKKFQAYERGQISYRMLSRASCYFDWVLPCFLLHPQEKGAGELRVISPEELVGEELLEETGAEYTKEILKNWDTDRVCSEAFKARLHEQFSYVYPYEREKNTKRKFTVSELKKCQYTEEGSGELLYKEEEVIPLLPKALTKQEGLTGAMRGSAYHKVMELLDFTKEYNETALEETLSGWKEEGQLTAEMYDCVRTRDIRAFLDTETAKRMGQAAAGGRLYAEQPFVLGVEDEEIYPEDATGELLLIQGIIDVWFEEQDGIVVLDYKTDQVRREEELKEKYKSQLDYYAKALERLTGKRVKEKIIYSFALRKEIAVS